MSERYSNVFTLPQNLYAVGSPVVIAAGTLLKDNQTGSIVAQLKFRSISNKTIKAVKVNLELFDTAGNPTGESVVFDYLDLSASRNVEFGQKTPVPVSDNKARSYNVAITEVVFGDRTVWTVNNGKWETLSNPMPLMLDEELLKQYRIKFGSESKYVANAEKDLWRCTCGTLNHEGEPCYTCYNTLSDLEAVDMAKLEEDKNARLMEEARQVAAESERLAIENRQKEYQKKKYIKLCTIAAVILIIVAVAIGAVTNSPQYIAKQTIKEGFNHYKNKDFYEAERVWKTVGQEPVDESALPLAPTAFPADEVDQSNIGYTPSAEELLQYGEPLLYEFAYYVACTDGFNEAIPLYEVIPDYKDSTSIVSEMQRLLNKYSGEYIGVTYRNWVVLKKWGKGDITTHQLNENIHISDLHYYESGEIGFEWKRGDGYYSIRDSSYVQKADGTLECNETWGPNIEQYVFSSDGTVYTWLSENRSGSGSFFMEFVWKKSA